MARLIGQKLTTTLGQSFVVENRAGAGGTLGARAVAEAEADGYTLLLGNTSTLVIAPAVYRNVGYDPVKSFAPVALLGATSNFFVVHPSFPPRTVQELVALAKAEPGKLNYASPGAGTPPHLIGEMLKLKTGIDIVHVPYKGGGGPRAGGAGARRADDIRNPGGLASVDPGRTGSGAGGDEREAQSAGVRRADHDRERHRGFRLRVVHRGGGAGRTPADIVASSTAPSTTACDRPRSNPPSASSPSSRASARPRSSPPFSPGNATNGAA